MNKKNKIYKRTKGTVIGLIEYVLKSREEARFNFRGSIYEYISWMAIKWNQENPAQKITYKDVGMTEELKTELNDIYFREKEKN